MATARIKMQQEEPQEEQVTPKQSQPVAGGSQPAQAQAVSRAERKSYSLPTGRYGYTPSASVQNALNYLNGVLESKPGAFQSSYEDQLNDIYDRIMNREKFSYDLNGDMLYNQYKDQYSALGKLAMMDTIGQASALTGGYGNTYAENAGYQAYQSYLQQLNDVVPQLYGMALDQYNREGDELYNQYGLTKGMYDTEYGQYRDSMSDYYNNLSYAQNAYEGERSFDYNDFANMKAQQNWEAEMAFQQERAAVADSQWEQEFALQKALQDYNMSLRSGSGGATGGYTNAESGGAYAYSPQTTPQTAAIQNVSQGDLLHMTGAYQRGGETALAQVVDSMKKRYGWSAQQAERIIDHVLYLGDR